VHAKFLFSAPFHRTRFPFTLLHAKKISLHAKFFCLSAMPSVFGCCMQKSKPNFLCRHHLLQDDIAYLSQQALCQNSTKETHESVTWNQNASLL
jgi:hypothetical protein